MEERFIVIDGNSLIFRAFHALPPMNRRDGTPTNAIYGFLTMLLSVVDNYQPTHLAVTFDLKGPTFRTKMYGDYKATRAKTPDDLHAQIPLLKDILTKLNILILEKQEFEADDIIGTVTAFGDEAGMSSLIFTGDKDALQLVSDHTHVLLTKKGVSETELYDREHLKEVYNLEPAQIIDLKGLMGDASDNIPGIKGVGEKTALKLLDQYGSIENIYAHRDDLPQNKMKEKILAGEESAYLSKELATIDRNVPIAFNLEDARFPGLDDDALYEVLRYYEFNSMIKRRGLQGGAGQAQVEEVPLDEAMLETLLLEVTEAGTLAICLVGDDYYFACVENKEYKVPAQATLFEDELSIGAVLKALSALWDGGAVELTVHDAKNFMHNCVLHGVPVPQVAFDPELAEYVLDPTQRDFSIEKLNTRYDCTGHAAALFIARKSQADDIEANGLKLVFYDIEMPLCHVLFEMEHQGFKIDVPLLDRFAEEYGVRIETLAAQIHALAGEDEFNIASTKQLGVILFEKLGLPVIKKTKTGYSTDAEVLEKLQEQHPIIEKIIEYRMLTKLKSTYLDGMKHLVDPNTNKVHTTFSQTATATGRISSIEPNLQNIPVRSDFTSQIRQLFIPSEEGNYIVAADYSQIELRVLAHISKDRHMRDAFSNEEDIHTRTAAEVFGVPLSEVTGEMRSSAKAVNFGIVYGISDFGLARNLGIPRYRAEEYINRYLHEFDGVSKYMRDIVESAKEHGYVKTLYGRIRYVNELRASNYNTRSFGERVALNTPIQGTAADIIKAAMIRVQKQLKEKGLKSKLISQVHDELIVDAVKEEVEQVCNILKETMENVIQLDVPLIANVAVGKTWAEAK